MLMTPGEGGNDGYIEKETIKNSDLICIGKVEEIRMEKDNRILSRTSFPIIINQDKIQVEIYSRTQRQKKTITMQGDWCIAKVFVHTVIKGEEPNKEINIHYFFPMTDPNGAYLDIFSPSLTYLLFLKKQQNYYSLVKYSNSMIELPFNNFDKVPGISESKNPEEKIKDILLYGLEKCEERNKTFLFLDAAIYTLKQLNLKQYELISLYKELTRKVKPEIKGRIISERIFLGDKDDSLMDILALSENEAYSDISFDLPYSAIAKLTDPKYVPVLTKILSSKNTSLKEKAIIALSSIKDKSAVPHLIKVLDDRNKEIRYQAIIALYNILYSPDQSEKFQGWATSFMLYEKNENLYIQKWKNWWKEEGQKEYGLPTN